MDTYKTGAEANADKAQQQRLLGALNAQERALRRDECGAWRIAGNHGHIYAWGDSASLVLYAAPGSALAWTWAKKRLDFCKVTQNGDDEGCLRLFGLPNSDQAETIRDILGIRKRTEYSPEALEAKKALIARARFSQKLPSSALEVSQ